MTKDTDTRSAGSWAEGDEKIRNGLSWFISTWIVMSAAVFFIDYDDISLSKATAGRHEWSDRPCIQNSFSKEMTFTSTTMKIVLNSKTPRVFFGGDVSG